MPRIDWAAAKLDADMLEQCPSGCDLHEERFRNLGAAYAALLTAVAPLLAAAEMATPGPWTTLTDTTDDLPVIFVRAMAGMLPFVATVDREDDSAFIVQARNTADALRDLLSGAK